MSDLNPRVAEVIALARETMFGKPIVENVERGLLVESIIAHALRHEGWSRTNAWAGWDLVHETGKRVEVKQAAARQTWDLTRSIKRRIRFDIATRTGHFDTVGWHKNEGRTRYADMYVFAYHPVTDETADHRDPAQWRFYVIPASKLPSTKTISLHLVQFLARGVSVDGLARQVACAAEGMCGYR